MTETGGVEMSLGDEGDWGNGGDMGESESSDEDGLARLEEDVISVGFGSIDGGATWPESVAV